MFAEYWAKPDATREAFRNGWFITGDTAVIENGIYRILGRTNIDILKTGGHKVSALEIEEALRQHPAIAECSVVGTADTSGQRGDCGRCAQRRLCPRSAIPPHLGQGIVGALQTAFAPSAA